MVVKLTQECHALITNVVHLKWIRLGPGKKGKKKKEERFNNSGKGYDRGGQPKDFFFFSFGTPED